MLRINANRHAVLVTEKIGDLLQRHFLAQEPIGTSMTQVPRASIGPLNPHAIHSLVDDLGYVVDL
jgi:hypothetical protein